MREAATFGAMSHCSQCGNELPSGAAACPFCGALTGAKAKAPGKTLLGVSAEDIAEAKRIAARAAEQLAPKGAAPAPAAEADPKHAINKASRTIVGMPSSAVIAGGFEAPVAQQARGASGTLVGVTTAQLGTRIENLAKPAGSGGASGTLLGVARPGIAPLSPGVEREEEGPTLVMPPRNAAPPIAPAGELGATIAPAIGRPIPAPPSSAGKAAWGAQRQRIPRMERAPRSKPRPKPEEKPSRRALALLITSGSLALVAVLVALLWPSPPPLTARPRADASGREAVELTCASCPNGTKVSVGAAVATIASSSAIVPLPSELVVGDNRLKVAIDRPDNGRDETVGVLVHVAYRIRPDLAPLQGEKPGFQIIAEATKGTSITLDDKPLSLASGRAVETIDVTDAITGDAEEVKTLSRKLSYVVTPSSGSPEKGAVNVSVGVVPLHLDAPGPHVVIEGSSFVLAGRTMKGAEILAAGRPIQVSAEGTFAQVMNVSAIGSTQIDVRAKITGMAPRIVPIRVRRVDKLETAAREFASESPLNWADLAKSAASSIGKAVAITGEISEVRRQGYMTVLLLDAPASAACKEGCTVRLAYGVENAVKRGDTLRVFGHLARMVAVPGRAEIPEIEVDFAIPQGRR